MIGVRAPDMPFIQPRRARHDFILFIVIKGEIRLTDEMPEGPDHWVVRTGDIHVIAPWIYQSSTQPFRPGIEFLWIHFEVSGPYLRHSEAEVARQIEMLFSTRRRPRDQSRWYLPRQLSLQNALVTLTRLHQDISQEQQLWGLADPGVQALAKTFLFRLHKKYVDSLLSSHCPEDASSQRIHANRAMVYIRKNYTSTLSNRHVARALSLNGTYLARCFRRVTGMTMGDAIQELRIVAAKRLLGERYYSIKEVAQLSGFQSSTYFGRVFKRIEGVSARKYSLRFSRCSS